MSHNTIRSIPLAEPTDVLEPYAVARRDDPAPAMLDFRGSNGTSFALPYQQLHAIAFDPVAGIRMEFQEHKIVVRGRNLRPVYDHLLSHRVTFLQEQDFDAAPESATFIDSINVERLVETA